MRNSNDKKYPTPSNYPVPQKNLLVLSCIDLRLTDDLTRFLNNDNLTNRYDLFILAGASLCTCTKYIKKKFLDPDIESKMQAWEKAFFDHLDLAHDLHEIKDVYIIEHVNYGAYKLLLKYGDASNEKGEVKLHKPFAEKLAKYIHAEKNTREPIYSVKR